MSSIGRIFRVTTFGESHAAGIGAIVDGVPPGLQLSENDIQPQLSRRRPGQSSITTPRNEEDKVKILSGTENGVTLGTPIGLFIPNENARPQDYNDVVSVPRPGHADYTYQKKYGIQASSGGGRASARETCARVAAGAIAEKWLKDRFNSSIVAWVHSIGEISMPEPVINGQLMADNYSRKAVDMLGTLGILRDPKSTLDSNTQSERSFAESIDDTVLTYLANHQVYNRNGILLKTPDHLDNWLSGEIIAVRCPHIPSACRMATLVRQLKYQKDSTGGTICCVVRNVPHGLGEPCFDKLPAVLAHAMMSIPAVKGFEIGSGFAGTKLRGSEHNDPFCTSGSGSLGMSRNNSGGVLGGISSGSEIYFRVAVKPVSTIGLPQTTVDYDGNETVLQVDGRHDPCVLPRAVSIVEAMTSLVLADAAMLQLARDGSRV